MGLSPGFRRGLVWGPVPLVSPLVPYKPDA